MVRRGQMGQRDRTSRGCSAWTDYAVEVIVVTESTMDTVSNRNPISENSTETALVLLAEEINELIQGVCYFTKV